MKRIFMSLVLLLAFIPAVPVLTVPCFAGGDELLQEEISEEPAVLKEDPAAEKPSEENAEALSDSGTETDTVSPFQAGIDFLYRLPALDGGVNTSSLMYSSDMVKIRLNALRDVYPHGSSWPLSVWYDGQYGWSGNGCTAFAFMVSDILFDGMPYTHKIYDGSYSYDDIHTGDYLWRSYPDGHVTVVVEKYDDHLVVVDGNWLAKINWDRTLPRTYDSRYYEPLTNYQVWFSRYPDHLLGDVSGNKCIDEYDAAVLLRGLVMYDLTGIDTAAADLDENEELSPSDCAAILTLTIMKEDGMYWRNGENNY